MLRGDNLTSRFNPTTITGIITDDPGLAPLVSFSSSILSKQRGCGARAGVCRLFLQPHLLLLLPHLLSPVLACSDLLALLLRHLLFTCSSPVMLDVGKAGWVAQVVANKGNSSSADAPGSCQKKQGWLNRWNRRGRAPPGRSSPGRRQVPLSAAKLSTRCFELTGTSSLALLNSTLLLGASVVASGRIVQL